MTQIVSGEKMKITYIVESVEKLDTVLRTKLNMSHRVVKENEKNILVNGKHTLRKDLLYVGDVIQIELQEVIPEQDKFINKYNCIEQELDVLYEDEYILAVNKPSNMPVHPSLGNYTNTLSNIVAPYLAKQNIYGIHIVTRLDKDTSGVCIFAKHPYIQELFNIRKQEIQLAKEYFCLVNGIVKEEHGVIEQPINRKENSIILREVNVNGKYAKTEYFVKLRNEVKNYTALKVLLHTGRTHQIRVHMSYIGHTLLGDDLYASDKDKKNILELIDRQALHCKKITFIHPITNQQVVLNANLPIDIRILK